MLLHEIVDNAAAVEAGTTALVAEGGRLTFAGLADRVARVATAVGMLIEPGERVVIVSENSTDFVVALYAVPRTGGVLAFGNTRHTPREISGVIDDCTASVVLGSAEQLDRLTEVAEGLPSVRRWVQLDGVGGGMGGGVGDDPHGTARRSDPGAGGVSPADPVALSTLVAAVTEPRPAVPVDERETAWIIHTSGTTGRPKGALLTHRSLVAALLNTTMARPVAPDDVYLFPFPLFHVAAYNVLHHHLRRRPVVLLPRFDALAVLEAVERERVTSISLAPTMVSMLLDHPDRHRHDLSSLRQIGYGASAMPLDLLRRTLSELPGVGLAQGYGMTELSGNAVFLDPDDHRRAATTDPQLLAAAGRPAPLAAVRIVDDADRDVAGGGVGEILVRGDQVCAGYWNDPEATAAARLDGWLRTGDVGRVDADGYLYVVDRKKDLIITGGENVASREVEDVVGTHPDVAAVAVVGVPDERWGERVCAVVVPRTGASVDPDGLMAWTEGRLAGYKRPRSVVVVDELPLNASGKIEKRRVRELLGRAGGP